MCIRDSEIVSQAPLAPMTGGPAAMAATSDGQLVLARDGVVRVVTPAGKPVAEWTVPGHVDGLTGSPTQAVVYASVDGKILTFDTAGQPRGEVGAPV